MIPTIREAFTRAWGKMKEVLFCPFDWRTWLILTLGFWLAELGKGGPNIPGNLITDKDTGKVLLQQLDTIAKELEIPLELFILQIAAVLFFIFITLGILFLWIRCRSRFIVLDMLIRGARAETFGNRWTTFQLLGNSFFLTQVLLTVAMVFFGFCTAAGAVLGISALLQGKEICSNSTAVILIGSALLIFTLLAVAIAIYLLLYQDFGALLMYRSGCSGPEALRILNRKLMERPWTFLRYLTGLLLFSIFVSVLILLFACITCCIGGLLLALPFLSTMILLPLLYARWQFTLEFFDNPEMLD